MRRLKPLVGVASMTLLLLVGCAGKRFVKVDGSQAVQQDLSACEYQVEVTMQATVSRAWIAAMIYDSHRRASMIKSCMGIKGYRVAQSSTERKAPRPVEQTAAARVPNPPAATEQIIGAGLYDMKNGAVSSARFTYSGTGKGKIVVRHSDGRTCTGEYVTFLEKTSAWGTIFALIYTNDDLVSETGKRLQIGQAMCASPSSADSAAMVMECEYATSPTSIRGFGACKDEAGRHYKLLF